MSVSPITPACVNCGAPLAGPFCAACGQRARTGRLSIRQIAAQALGELSPVDHGIVFTALAVLRRPGRMAREYVEGRTVRYVGPVKYFTLLVGAAQIVVIRVGVLDELVSGLFEGFYQHRVPSGAQARALGLLTRYFVSVSAVAVPIFAAWTRLLTRRARLHYAEHLVLALYTGAQQVALFTIAALVIAAVRVPGLDVVYLPLAFAYQASAVRQFAGLSRGQAAWRTLAAAVLTLFVSVLVLVLAFAELGRR